MLTGNPTPMGLDFADLDRAGAAAEQLEERLRTRTARVAVIGLGYVGLPLAVEFARAGFAVLGIEVSEEKVAQLGEGRSYVQEVDGEAVAELLRTGQFVPTLDFGLLSGADVVIVCVPTPLRKSKEPNISYVVAAAEQIRGHLHRGQLVVLESTTYPGTTDELLLSKLQETGLSLDRDFFLAFSPERIDPGNPRYRTHNIPKVIGGVSSESTRLARLAYEQVVEKVFEVSSARVAETAKLLENTFRNINIALVNELAQLCRRLGVDVWEVIDAAGTKPFGFMPFYPGPGIGRHCIPLDPHYLSWKARTLGFEARFIGLAEEINSAMPSYVVNLAADALNDRSKCLRGARVLVLGVAYKEDIDDVRESPAISIIESLLAKGSEVSFHDPYVAELQLAGSTLRSVPLEDSLESSDCVLIITAHSVFDMREIASRAQLVVDTRNATRGVAVGNVVKL